MESKHYYFKKLASLGWKRVKLGEDVYWQDPVSGHKFSLEQAIELESDRLNYYDGKGNPPIRVNVTDQRRKHLTCFNKCEGCKGRGCGECFGSGYIFGYKTPDDFV